MGRIMMKKEPRSDERFVTRCAIADNILRYSFRLDRPDLSKRPKKEDALIDWAVKEAYAMFEPLVGDRIAKPFGVGCLPPLYGKEAVQNFLGENAIAQLYCQLREIIGEENPVSAYEAVKYTYFGSKEKSSEKGIVTGMDYLIQNNVYTFQTGSMALNKKSELDTFEFQDKEEEKKIKKKCSGANSTLKSSSESADKKLSILPQYKSFFVSGKNSGFKLSDLDVAAIFRRYNKAMAALYIVKDAYDGLRPEPDKHQLTMQEIRKLKNLYNNLCTLNDNPKLTNADRLYITIRIEQALGIQLTMSLWENVQKLHEARRIELDDVTSIKQMSTCHMLGNIINRAALVDMAFKTLNEMLDGMPAETWRTEIEKSIKGNWGTTPEMENESEIIRKWKKIYEEGMDFMANWVVPLYNTCFCTILVKAVKADLNKSNNSSEIIQTTFEILADYIDEGKIKFEPHISESVCNSVKRKPDMVRKLSDYIIETLTPVEETEAPITCNELDQMIPKKVDGHYLNYIKTQFMDRKNPVAGEPRKS